MGPASSCKNSRFVHFTPCRLYQDRRRRIGTFGVSRRRADPYQRQADYFGRNSAGKLAVNIRGLCCRIRTLRRKAGLLLVGNRSRRELCVRGSELKIVANSNPRKYSDAADKARHVTRGTLSLHCGYTSPAAPDPPKGLADWPPGSRPERRY